MTAISTKRISHKTIPRGGSFGGSTVDPSVIYAWLIRDFERLIEELEFYQVLIQKLTIWVRYRNSEAWERRTALAIPRRPLRCPAR